jgi:serine/threonine protein phosphatase PrpC
MLHGTVRHPLHLHAASATGVMLDGARFPFDCSATAVKGAPRATNQDAVLCRPDIGLFVLADGLGGHAAGEVAAAVALAAVEESLSSPAVAARTAAFAEQPSLERRRHLLDGLREACLTANRRVVEAAAGDPSRRGMASTLDILLLAGTSAFLAHVGDARAYLGRAGRLLQLTDDHSSYDALRTSGKRSHGGDSKSPLAHSLGTLEPLRVDTAVIPLAPEDILLLCSDGTTPALDSRDADVERIASLAPTTAAAELVALAHAKDDSDDAAAIVVRFGAAVTAEVATEPAHAERDRETLDVTPLFAELSADRRATLEAVLLELEFDADRTLQSVMAGDRVAYVVLEGCVALPNGRLLGAAGFVFPESLLDVSVREPLPRTVERTRVLRLRQCDFLAVCERDPRLAADLHRRLARHVALTR